MQETSNGRYVFVLGVFLLLLAQIYMQESYRLRLRHTISTDMPWETVAPAIADLDGNGVPEIVYAGVDAPDAVYSSEWDEGELIPKHTYFFPHGKNQRVVKLGAFSVSSSSPKERSIVVVTNTLDVMLLDKSLSLQWSAKLPDPSQILGNRDPDGFEIALLGTTVPIWKKDDGSVIVAIRSHSTEDVAQARLRNELAYGRSGRRQGKESESEPNSTTHSGLIENHIHYYCFESRTGALRWFYNSPTRDPTEIDHTQGDNDSAAKATAPSSEHVQHLLLQQSWKMHIASNSGYFEHLPWYEFKAYFEKQSLIDRKKRRRVDWSHDSVGITEEVLPAFVKREDYVSSAPPNVILAHTSLGVEAIHLYTGRPVTSLALRPHTLYHDLNKDHSINEIWTRVGEEVHSLDLEEDERGCGLFVGAGVPHERSLAFKTSLCTLAGITPSSRNTLKALNPLVVTSRVPSNGWIPTNELEEQIFVLLSSGILTAVTPTKESAWHVSFPFSWDAHDVSLTAMHATLNLYPTTPNDSSGDMLLVVSPILSLISLQGELLFHTTLPHPPVGEPIFVDLNGDGYNDVIIRTETELQLYILEASLTAGALSSFLMVATAAVIAVFVLNYETIIGPSAKKKE